MTSDFEGFLYQILSITLFPYLNYILIVIYFTMIMKHHACWHRCLRSDGLRYRTTESDCLSFQTIKFHNMRTLCVLYFFYILKQWCSENNNYRKSKSGLLSETYLHWNKKFGTDNRGSYSRIFSILSVLSSKTLLYCIIPAICVNTVCRGNLTQSKIIWIPLMSGFGCRTSGNLEICLVYFSCFYHTQWLPWPMSKYLFWCAF